MENIKLEIQICMGSSCFARGNNKTLEIIKKFCFENNLETHINLSGCLCEGKCNNGPNLKINDQEYDHVDPNSIIDILNYVIKWKATV